MGHEQDPNFAAIDPAAMADLVAKLDGAARTIDEQAPGLKGRFESHGVATGNVTTIMQVASWVHDQLPMLRRRQSLAQAMVDGGFAWGAGSTWTFVDTGDNLGAFRTPEEARRAAGELAARVKGDPTGHDLPDEVFEQLLRYGSDPDFATEFYAQIGPEGISKLYVGAHRDRHLGDGPDPRKAMAVGISMATASHRLDFDDAWIDRVGRRTTTTPQLYVAPFLRYGNWDKDFLKRIGTRELKGPAIPLDPERAALIWDGIARNPLAAAEFYDENFELIQKKSAYDGLLRGDAAQGNRTAWANMIRSATVDARDVYARLRLDDPHAWPRNLAEDNTARLIRYVKDHKDEHVFGELQAAYGEVVKEYWDDLAYSVTSPVPQVGDHDNPGRDGIELPRDAWTGRPPPTCSPSSRCGWGSGPPSRRPPTRSAAPAPSRATRSPGRTPPSGACGSSSRPTTARSTRPWATSTRSGRRASRRASRRPSAGPSTPRGSSRTPARWWSPSSSSTPSGS
jgi:hypothetical protein